jgi:WD40 repeat protein
MQLFDVRENRVRWQREGSGWECVALHPQAGLFAAFGGRIVQLDLATGVIVRTIAQPNECIRAVAVEPRGGLIAWLDDAGGIEVRRLNDSRQLWVQKSHGGQTLPETHRPTMFANVLQFSADGRYLVTSANEGEWVLAVWNVKSGSRQKTLRGHDHVVNGARFLPDGTLASWGRDGTLRVWDLKRGVARRVFSLNRLTSSAPSRGSRSA